jgi:hypothetical protein
MVTQRAGSFAALEIPGLARRYATMGTLAIDTWTKWKTEQT